MAGSDPFRSRALLLGVLSLICSGGAISALFIRSSGGGEWRYGVCMGLAALGAILAFKGRETSWLADKPRPIAPLIGMWINLPLAVLAGLFWWVVHYVRI